MASASRVLLAATLILHFTTITETTSLHADDLDTIRARVTAPYLAPPNAKSVTNWIESMQQDGTWTDIEYDNKGRSAWAVPAHLSRVTCLARAYCTPKSTLHDDPEVLAAALKGLDAWLRLDPQNPNWWWNQIGAPKSLLPIMLLLDDELSEAQREGGLKFLRRAQISMTGQNLVWVTEITAGRGLLENDADLVAKAYSRIADEIRVGTSEGIQPDFSFHQHGPCLYSHGYGASFIVDCARIAVRVDGTTMAFPNEKIELLSHLILDGTQWMIRGTGTDFGAEGREIARKGQSTRHLVAAANYMLELDTGREDEFRALAARAAGETNAQPLVGNRHFWRADFMTHHRPDYYASARMHSKRLANTDGPANSEGLLSHHLADGCFVLMQTGHEYRDIFGVWDWQKIPGTTVRQKSNLKGSPRRMGTTDFVGGVSDGTYGLAACDFQRDGLTAKKSWCFFDDEIVCLGAGINAPSGEPIVTTLNQCRLKGNVTVSKNGTGKALEPGNHTLKAPKWLWHDSAAYLLLEPANVYLQHGPRSGTWHASNRRYPDRDESHELFTAWIDHGETPKNESYAYVVVPGVDHDEIPGYVTTTPVRVLANNEKLQAVAHDRLGLVAAAFFRPGNIEISTGCELQVDQPCLLLLREKTEHLLITLANPKNTAIDVQVRLIRPKQGLARQTVISLPDGWNGGSSVSFPLSLSEKPVSSP